MKKKGFTLIELLAVIIILGIIAVIAIPVVSKLVDESRLGAFESSVTSIEKKVEEACAAELIKDTKVTEQYTITNGNISPKLEVKGDIPDGDIYVTDKCDITYTLSDNRHVATKNDPNEKPIFGICDGDCKK